MTQEVYIDIGGRRVKGWIEGRRVYAVCPTCGKVVCVNKIIFGSLHFCLGGAK